MVAERFEIDKSAPDCRLKRRQIKRKYWMIVVGVIIHFCGYTSFLILQSSIRIEDGLGSKVTMTTYLCQMAINFLLAPFILRLIGAKKALITAECAYMLYAISNAISHPSLLYVGAVLAAYAEGIFWLPIGISFVFFAQKYHCYSNKCMTRCIMEFGGIMLSAFQLNFVVGNLLVSVILNIFKNMETSASTNSNAESLNSSHSMIAPGYFTPTVSLSESEPYDRLMYCGANDCQDPNVTQKNIDQYVPTNPMALYVLSGVLLLLMLCGMIIHIVLFPNMPFASFSTFNKGTTRERESLSSNSVERPSITNSKEGGKIKTIFILSFNSVKDTIIQLLHPKQFFLITPTTAYLGYNAGFALFESTRAFGSCILGVSQVGWCMIAEAGANAIQAFFIGKIFGKRGRLPLYAFAMLWDIGIYSFCLLWRPTSDTTWIVYSLFVALGVSNATWQMISATCYGSDFYKSKEISFNLWCITFSAGMSIHLALSTLLCISSKLYIGIIWVVLAGILGGISEIMELRKNRKQNNIESSQSRDLVQE